MENMESNIRNPNQTLFIQENDKCSTSKNPNSFIPDPWNIWITMFNMMLHKPITDMMLIFYMFWEQIKGAEKQNI